MAKTKQDIVMEQLALHRWKTVGVTSVECECGVITKQDNDEEVLKSFPADQAFRSHLAQVILAALERARPR